MTKDPYRRDAKWRRNGPLRAALAIAVVLAIIPNWKFLRYASKVDLSGKSYIDSPTIPHRAPRSSNVDATSQPETRTRRPQSFWNCTPTHHACDNYDGLLHIESGDFGGAGGTIFFQFVVGQLMYANEHNLLPFVHFDNFSHLVYDAQIHSRSPSGPSTNTTIQAILLGAEVSSNRDRRMYHAIYPGPPMYNDRALLPGTLRLGGTGVWSHYFYPVSNFCPGDASCSTKPLVKMERAHVSPGLHLYAPWAPRIWRYSVLPDHIGQPHVPLTEWLLPQRKRASAIVKEYYHFQPLITDQVNQRISTDCIGLHIRWTDKGVSRRRLDVSEFLPYVTAYLRGRQEATACVYVATDAVEVVHNIQSGWPPSVLSKLILSQATVRSPNETAVFDMESHHLTNQEVLRDIAELSNCGFILHGNSAVSESAIYLNSNLMYQSVNLEDPTHMLVHEFEDLVRNVTRGSIDSEYWTNIFQPPLKWWEPVLLLDDCLPGENRNLTFSLSPRWLDDTMSINRWTTRVFVKLWQQLAAQSKVVMDASWSKWFQHPTCEYLLSSFPISLQETIHALSRNSFFEKRFKSVVKDENAMYLRSNVSQVISGLLTIQPHITQRAKDVFNATQPSTCLAIHIADPGYRRKDGKWMQQNYPKAVYRDFIDAYVRAGGACLYIATDSFSIWETFYYPKNNMTADVTVYSQQGAVRNRYHVPAHFMEERIERLGSETLVDIWNMQRCGYLLHSYSPVSEAALYWNPKLRSVLVPDRKSIHNFTEDFVGRFRGQ